MWACHYSSQVLTWPLLWCIALISICMPPRQHQATCFTQPARPCGVVETCGPRNCRIFCLFFWQIPSFMQVLCPPIVLRSMEDCYSQPNKSYATLLPLAYLHLQCTTSLHHSLPRQVILSCLGIIPPSCLPCRNALARAFKLTRLRDKREKPLSHCQEGRQYVRTVRRNEQKGTCRRSIGDDPPVDVASIMGAEQMIVFSAGHDYSNPTNEGRRFLSNKWIIELRNRHGIAAARSAFQQILRLPRFTPAVAINAQKNYVYCCVG